jgi:prepilin-type N-terminal cleavage/methylation domain-containing protein
MRFLKKSKAFTMLELMIVVTVIGILALVLVPRMRGAKDSVRDSAVEANLLAVKSVAERLIDDFDNPNLLATAILKSLDGEVENPYSGSKGVLFAYFQEGVSESVEGTQTDFHDWKLGRTKTEDITWEDMGNKNNWLEETGLASSVQVWINGVGYDHESGSHAYFASNGNGIGSSITNAYPGEVDSNIRASQGAVILSITKRVSSKTLWGSNMQINLYAFDGKTQSMTSREKSPTIIQLR